MGVTYSQANLKSASFTEAHLEGANFRYAQLLDITYTKDSILSVKTLYNATMNDELHQFIQENKPELLEAPSDLRK